MRTEGCRHLSSICRFSLNFHFQDCASTFLLSAFVPESDASLVEFLNKCPFFCWGEGMERDLWFNS